MSAPLYTESRHVSQRGSRNRRSGRRRAFGRIRWRGKWEPWSQELFQWKGGEGRLPSSAKLEWSIGADARVNDGNGHRGAGVGSSEEAIGLGVGGDEAKEEGVRVVWSRRGRSGRTVSTAGSDPRRSASAAVSTAEKPWKTVRYTWRGFFLTHVRREELSREWVEEERVWRCSISRRQKNTERLRSFRTPIDR